MPSRRLNVDGRGDLVGEFRGEDRILIITQSGIVKTIVPEITVHFDDDMIVLEKWIPKKPISAIYFDGEKQKHYVKRFLIENESKEECFISEHASKPIIELVYNKERNKEQRSNTSIDIEEFISIKGIKAQGNQLTGYKIKQINILESLAFEEEKEEPYEEIEVIDEIESKTDYKSRLPKHQLKNLF